MSPEDWAKVIVEVSVPTLAVVGAAWRIVERITSKFLDQRDRSVRQDAVLEAQSRQLEWQSRVLEILSKKQNSDPPPREKLATLDDAFDWDPIVRAGRKR